MQAPRRQLITALPLVALSRASLAQGTSLFPSRPIRIVPFGTAGGPIDALARAYGERLEKRWGQPVLVDPKPGASGVIAADFVAKSAPDGHTVMMTLSLTHVNNAILMPKLPYDPVKDFTPLSMVATGGPMLVARAESPWTTLKDLVDHARAKGSLSFGTWGNGSTAHLYGELLQRQFGLNLVHVPYKAEAMAHADLFGGLLDFAWANPASASTHARSGKMKVLGIAARRRVSVMPEVRTFAEQGLNGYDVDSWIGFYAPGKLASELQATWVNALRELTASPELQARLTAFGFEPLGNTPAQFMDVYRNDYPRAAELIKAAGVTL